MDRLPNDTVFPSSAHNSSEQSEPDPKALINTLEMTLRAVAALPAEASPMVGFARRVLTDFERVRAADRLGTLINEIAHRLGVNYGRLISKSRTARIATCRQIAMYLCKRVSKASYPVMGAYFGRDHSTAYHAVALIAKRMRKDAGFRREIEKLARQLTATTTALAVAA
jgi:chromosomal replication initiation ATPase DnaA